MTISINDSTLITESSLTLNVQYTGNKFYALKISLLIFANECKYLSYIGRDQLTFTGTTTTILYTIIYPVKIIPFIK
jgi:hypothetical protein